MTEFSADVTVDVGFGAAVRVLGLWSAIALLGLSDQAVDLGTCLRTPI
jgi:hypothetical protein